MGSPVAERSVVHICLQMDIKSSGNVTHFELMDKANVQEWDAWCCLAIFSVKVLRCADVMLKLGKTNQIKKKSLIFCV